MQEQKQKTKRHIIIIKVFLEHSTKIIRFKHKKTVIKEKANEPLHFMKTPNGKKKKASKSENPPRKEHMESENEEPMFNPEVLREARAALLILCGLFLMFAITNPDLSGSIGKAIGTFLNALTGWASFMFPFMLVIAGCHTIKKFPKKIILFYPAVTIALIWIIEIARASLFPNAFGQPGAAGSFIADIVTSAVGPFGAGGLLLIAASGCFLLFSGKTAGDVASGASEKIRQAVAKTERTKPAGITRPIQKRPIKKPAVMQNRPYPLKSGIKPETDEDCGEDLRRNRFLSDEPISIAKSKPAASAHAYTDVITERKDVKSAKKANIPSMAYLLQPEQEEEPSMLIMSGNGSPQNGYEDLSDQGSLEIESGFSPSAIRKNTETGELMFISEDIPEDEEDEAQDDYEEFIQPEPLTASPIGKSGKHHFDPPAILPQIFRNDFIPRIPRYPRPSISILAEKDPYKAQTKPPRDYSEALVEKLESFNVEASVTGIVRGPAITRYELKLGDRIKVSKFTSLHQDLSVFFANKIRIEAPVPGKSCVGIEVPNESIEPVYIRDVIGSEEFKKKNRKIPIALGKDINGNTVVGDLAKMPHLLVAGSTGSGKSVCMNCIIASILFKFSPAEAQLVMIDPKQVELSMYEGIPHLIDIKATPDSRIITDPKIASAVLTQMTEIMDARYKELKRMKTKNIFEYNEKSENPMPYLIILIDEFFDLMMVSGGAIEAPICRLTQLGRAAGIHLVIATQRPTVNCITGTIKVNVPSRIAFAVTNAIDSKTIIDKAGAENLLGKGDMLYQPADAGEPRRVQGAFMSTEETEKLVSFWQAQPIPENMLAIEAVSQEERDDDSDEGDNEKDELYDEAIEYILSSPKNASVSSLQRKFRIGYPRAGKIMDQLEMHGVVGPADGSKPRKILIGHTSE